MIAQTLIDIYDRLYHRFGPQRWWPGESPFEIIVGAILTQNTSWTNVEKAIRNLKVRRCLDPESIRTIPHHQLAELIRPAGYFNIKAKRLKNFVTWLFEQHHGRLENLCTVPTDQLRAELLSVKGIGLETADSILLYALDRPIFVVDAYTARIAARHQLIGSDADYEQLRALFQDNLPQDTQLFNEYHALLVKLAKDFCRPKPCCTGCPLESFPHNLETDRL